MTYAMLTETMEPEQERAFQESLRDPFESELTDPMDKMRLQATQLERVQRLRGQATASDLTRHLGGVKR